MLYAKLILNITQTAVKKPTNDTIHFDLNDGLYDGDEPKWLRNEMRQSEPYVIMKNIEIICATTSTFPSATKMMAIKQVISDALTGSWSFFLYLLSQ